MAVFSLSASDISELWEEPWEGADQCDEFPDIINLYGCRSVKRVKKCLWVSSFCFEDESLDLPWTGVNNVYIVQGLCGGGVLTPEYAEEIHYNSDFMDVDSNRVSSLYRDRNFWQLSIRQHPFGTASPSPGNETYVIGDCDDRIDSIYQKTTDLSSPYGTYNRVADTPGYDDNGVLVPSPETITIAGSASPTSERIELSGSFREDVESDVSAAMSIINNIHGAGTLSNITVLDGNNEEYYASGSYVRSIGDAVLEIRIYSSYNSLETMIHEFGHWIDHKWFERSYEKNSAAPNSGVGSELVWGTDSILFIDFLNVARASRLYSSIQNNSYIVPRVKEYLCSPKELWARAYFQFIAVESNDETLRYIIYYSQIDPESPKGLNNLTSGNLSGSGWFGDQWDDDDFIPVGREVARILSRKGWLKSHELNEVPPQL